MCEIRSISSLPLSKGNIDLLVHHGFRTVSDILELKPTELSQELDVSSTRALEILSAAQAFDKVDVKQTAMDLIKRVSKTRSIISFCRSVDKMLGGGIAIGQVTELCGVPGVGKSQFCMQLAVDVQIPEIFTGCGGRAVYIDTEGGFSAARLATMAEALSSHLKKVAARDKVTNRAAQAAGQRAAPTMSDVADTVSRDSLLEGVLVYRSHDSTELLAVLGHMPAYLTANPDVRLIIVDSVAFPFRQDNEDSSARTRILSRLMQNLQKMAYERNVAVVLTNHMVTKFDRPAQSGQWQGHSSSVSLAPALGVQWSHGITNRLELLWEGNTRTVAIRKSTYRPLDTACFAIVNEGVRDLKPVGGGSRGPVPTSSFPATLRSDETVMRPIPLQQQTNVQYDVHGRNMAANEAESPRKRKFPSS